MWASFHWRFGFTVNEQQLLLTWLSFFTFEASLCCPVYPHSFTAGSCRTWRAALRDKTPRSGPESHLCSLYGLDYWPELWKRRSTHCYCWTYLLKHIQQIHRIQRKRWQFTSSSTLLYSTDMGAQTLHQAHCPSAPPWSEPSSRLLHMLCIHCSKGAFCHSLGPFI